MRTCESVKSAVYSSRLMPFTLSATQVTKRYGGVVALADGTLTVSAGEVVAVGRANGSGKSTLSKIITGVVAPATAAT